jgi:hypothetical protein
MFFCRSSACLESRHRKPCAGNMESACVRTKDGKVATVCQKLQRTKRSSSISSGLFSRKLADCEFLFCGRIIETVQGEAHANVGPFYARNTTGRQGVRERSGKTSIAPESGSETGLQGRRGAREANGGRTEGSACDRSGNVSRQDHHLNKEIEMATRPKTFITEESRRQVQEELNKRQAWFDSLPPEEQAKYLKWQQETILMISEKVAEEARQRRISMNPYRNMCQCGRGCFG